MIEGSVHRTCIPVARISLMRESGHSALKAPHSSHIGMSTGLMKFSQQSQSQNMLVVMKYWVAGYWKAWIISFTLGGCV